jgi:hypothetical protein
VGNLHRCIDLWADPQGRLPAVPTVRSASPRRSR